MEIRIKAEVTYTSHLSASDERKIKQYLDEHADEVDFLSDKEKILQAINALYDEGEIDIYDNCTESDFSTEEIEWSEFEERTPSEIISD